MRTPVSTGVVGLGPWGQRLAQTFQGLPGAELRWVCDVNPSAVAEARQRLGHVGIAAEVDDLFRDESLDVVVVATPPTTHYELARRALEAGKHVFVETPLALTGVEADDLVARSERSGRFVMVGHVLLFHPAVRRLKELVDHGSLGEVYYLTSQRVGPPNVRRQESVLWDLGVHDVAVVLYLLGDQPVEAGARGDSYVKAGIADVVVASLAFATGIRAHIQLSRLEGVPTRRLTAVGSRSTAVFEELERERPLTVFDHDPLGEISSPRLPWEEPLRAECAHFVEAVRSSAEPVAGVREGAAVVNVLEALARSAEHGGVGEAVGGIEARPDVIRLPARTS